MKVLMCQPTYFSVDYEINPWMHKDEQVDKQLAQKQWSILADTYRELGVGVETISPVLGLPDMVFTANAGLVLGREVVLASFKYSERQPETEYFASWFKKNKFEIVELAEGEYFEGQGEALWFGDTLIAGWGFRATIESHQKLQETIAPNLLSIKLIDPRFYHLDTCFLPIDRDTAAYYPAAFDFSSKKELQTLIPNLIEVSEKEAEAFACNSVVIGKKILMPKGAADLPKSLEELGFEIIALETSEFKKSGGGIRCLTLTLEN